MQLASTDSAIERAQLPARGPGRSRRTRTGRP